VISNVISDDQRMIIITTSGNNVLLRLLSALLVIFIVTAGKVHSLHERAYRYAVHLEYRTKILEHSQGS